VPLIVEAIRKRDVLRGLSLRVDDGEIVCVFGENGAGKSTLLKIVAGVIDADSGHVAGVTRREIGYVPEAADVLPELTPRELVRLVAALKRVHPPDGDLGLAVEMDRPLGSLSLGQRRRACLLAALVGEPRLLILDEPTNGLDAGGLEVLTRTLEGRTCLLATHDRTFARALGARCLVLTKGLVETTVA
jgi:ABC-type multidrug transport system ATPase subunit